MSARYVIVFRSRLRPGLEVEYGARAEAIYALARQMPGLVSTTDFTAADGERCAIIEFDSAEHLHAWRDHPEHRLAQQEGRDRWYASYSIQICVVERSSSFDGTTWTRNG